MTEAQIRFGILCGLAAGWGLLCIGALAQPFSVAWAAKKKGRSGGLWFIGTAIYSWGVVPSVLGACGFFALFSAAPGTLKDALVGLLPLILAYIVVFVPWGMLRRAKER